MKYQVTGFNNFCRVFEIPAEFPKGYCFGEGLPTTFRMVDWFNPVVDLPQWAITEEKYQELLKSGELTSEGHEKQIESEELQASLTEFLRKKNYARAGRQYLVICKFGLAFMFNKQ